MKYFVNVSISLLLFCASLCAADPLPSWNEGPAKKAITEFIEKTTDQSHPEFVAPEERFVVFDQDGTLWIEHPIYTQIVYCFDRLATIAAQKPEFKEVEPFKTVLSGDKAAIGKLTSEDLKKIAVAALTGMSVETFDKEVKQWIATAKDSRWKRLYTELYYQPMLEVIKYFQANGYKTYIATGGGQDFVRVFSHPVYGIPVEQVIGSAERMKYLYDKNNKPFLKKEPKLLLESNFVGKPEGIHLIIGRRPNAAFGNSTGDQQMLEYTKGGNGLRLAMLVLHDDSDREYAYGPAQGLPDTKVGTFSQALYDEAIKDGWIVISMKKDWNRIFSFDPILDKTLSESVH
jgi:phosphoglycolate phosphatase-like HAD superfamily hydrolase